MLLVDGRDSMFLEGIEGEGEGEGRGHCGSIRFGCDIGDAEVGGASVCRNDGHFMPKMLFRGGMVQCPKWAARDQILIVYMMFIHNL